MRWICLHRRACSLCIALYVDISLLCKRCVWPLCLCMDEINAPRVKVTCLKWLYGYTYKDVYENRSPLLVWPLWHVEDEASKKKKSIS